MGPHSALFPFIVALCDFISFWPGQKGQRKEGYKVRKVQSGLEGACRKGLNAKKGSSRVWLTRRSSAEKFESKKQKTHKKGLPGKNRSPKWRLLFRGGLFQGYTFFGRLDLTTHARSFSAWAVNGSWYRGLKSC